MVDKETVTGACLGYYYNWFEALRQAESSWKELTKKDKKATAVFISGWDLPESYKTAREVYKEWEKSEPYRSPDYFEEMRDTKPSKK